MTNQIDKECFVLEQVNPPLKVDLCSSCTARVIKVLRLHDCNEEMVEYIELRLGHITDPCELMQLALNVRKLNQQQTKTPIECIEQANGNMEDTPKTVAQYIEEKYKISSLPKYIMQSIEKQVTKKKHSLWVTTTKLLENYEIRTPTSLTLLMNPIQLLNASTGEPLSLYHINFIPGEPIYFDGHKLTLNDKTSTKKLSITYKPDYISVTELAPSSLATQTKLSKCVLSEGEVFTIGLISLTICTLDTNHIQIRFEDQSAGQRTTHTLTKTTTIGRSPYNDISLQDSRVSKHHLIMKKSYRCWVLEDLNSHNGTFKYLSTLQTLKCRQNSRPVTLTTSQQLVYSNVLYELSINKSIP